MKAHDLLLLSLVSCSSTVTPSLVCAPDAPEAAVGSTQPPMDATPEATPESSAEPTILDAQSETNDSTDPTDSDSAGQLDAGSDVWVSPADRCSQSLLMPPQSVCPYKFDLAEGGNVVVDGATGFFNTTISGCPNGDIVVPPFSGRFNFQASVPNPNYPSGMSPYVCCFCIGTNTDYFEAGVTYIGYWDAHAGAE